MSQPTVLFLKQFMVLKIKEEKVRIGEPAKDEEITAIFENIHVVDSGISTDKLK